MYQFRNTDKKDDKYQFELGNTAERFFTITHAVKHRMTGN